jgi:hypothetical protein
MCRPCSTSQKYFLESLSIRDCINHRAIVWQEGYGKFKKNSMTSSGLELATFQLLA